MLLLKANLNLLTALEIVEVAGLAAGEAPDHLDSDTGVALTTRAANEPSEKFSQSRVFSQILGFFLVGSA